MSNLILPQKWTSQPQIPVGIDWSNPLSPKSGIWIPDRNLVNGRGITLGGSGGVPTSTIIPSGRALYTNGQYVQTDNPANAFSVCTWLAIIKPAAAPTNANFSSFFQTSQVTLNWNHTSSGYQGAFTINNGGAYPTAKFTSGFTAGAEVVIGGTYDGTSLRIYRNGVLENTVVAGNSLSGVTVNSLQFLGGQGGTASWAGSCSLFYWDETKAVPSAGMALLSANPWQIFKAPARRIWVAGAGGNGTATITGVSGSGQVGTLFPSGNASVSLSGAFGTGSVGSVAASVSVATTITGVSGTGSVGTTTQTGTANVTAPSAAGTGSVGTVSASGSGSPDGNVTITGIAGTGQVGTLAAAGNAAVSIAGVSGAGSVGSVTPSVTVSTTITGVSGTGSVGTTTQTGTANTTVSSAVGTGLVGDVSAVGTSQNGNAVISGVSGIGSVGIVVATSGSLRTNRGGGWETYVAPIRKKTVKEVKKEFELLSYAEVVAEQKTAEIKIQHTQAKIQEIKSNVSAVKPFSLAPEIAKLKLLIAEEKIKIEALRELETKILIHAKIKKEKEKLLTDLAFIAEYLMDEDEYDYD